MKKHIYIIGIMSLATRDFITQALEPMDIIPTDNIANADLILEPQIAINRDDSAPDLAHAKKTSAYTISTHTNDSKYKKHALRTYNNIKKTQNKIYNHTYINRTTHK